MLLSLQPPWSGCGRLHHCLHSRVSEDPVVLRSSRFSGGDYICPSATSPRDNCPSPCLGWGPAQLAFTVLANCRFMSVATFVPWEGVRQLGGQMLACSLGATVQSGAAHWALGGAREKQSF